MLYKNKNTTILLEIKHFDSRVTTSVRNHGGYDFCVFQQTPTISFGIVEKFSKLVNIYFLVIDLLFNPS